MMRRAFLLLLLIAISSASLLWQFSTDGPVSAKPVAYQNLVLVASDDGHIYALDPAGGARRWKTFVGKEPNEVFIFDNSIYASITEGKLAKLDREGKITWTLNLNTTQHNVSYVYGAAAGQKYIFISADNGIYSVEKNGSVRTKLASFNGSVVTPPAAGTDFVVYGRGNELQKIKEGGQKEWTVSLDSDVFWVSRPVIDSGTIYIGALDEKLHAYAVTGGAELWSIRTRNWVLSTPEVKNGRVYFGSNDGRVYASDTSGTLSWFAQTPLAVQSEPEAGLMGGRDVVFVGGTDRSIYAIDQASGEIVWKGSAAGGAAGSPLFYQNEVIFGSQDNNVYAYSTERACSITNPLEGDVIGRKEVGVRGKYVSEAGGASVLVNVNGAGWEPANVSDPDWVYYIDPSGKFSQGINVISCKVVDASGEESGDVHTTVTVNHDPGIPLSDLVVKVSSNIVENAPFTIYVNDGDDGSPVDRFKIAIDGNEYDADKNFTLVLPEGSYSATVKKVGFNDATIKITVNAKGVNPIYLVVGIVLILIIVLQVWSRFLRQRFVKR